jgi:hypothetical protein
LSNSNGPSAYHAPAHEYSDVEDGVVKTAVRSPYGGASGFHYTSDPLFDFGNISSRQLGDNTTIGKFADTHYRYAGFVVDNREASTKRIWQRLNLTDSKPYSRQIFPGFSN